MSAVAVTMHAGDAVARLAARATVSRAVAPDHDVDLRLDGPHEPTTLPSLSSVVGLVNARFRS